MTSALASVLAAFALAVAVAGCVSPGVTVSDTYCRDTFFITTSKRDTEETKAQIDRHNSRRLCRCSGDCPP